MRMVLIMYTMLTMAMCIRVMVIIMMGISVIAIVSVIIIGIVMVRFSGICHLLVDCRHGSVGSCMLIDIDDM